MIKCIILMLIFFFVFFTLIKYNNKKSKYIAYKSDIDNRTYLVIDKFDKRTAANLLATIRGNIFLLNTFLQNNKEKYEDYIKYIDQLNNKIQDVKLSEGTGDDGYTSYTVNKGEKIIFCLRDYNKSIHDINLIMYVVIHELAHVACPEQGHTALFSQIFKFLAEISIEIGIYKKIDFQNSPEKYCGMTISDSIV